MSVSDKVYQSAVKGRSDFRNAFRLERKRVKELELLLLRCQDHLDDSVFSDELHIQINEALSHRNSEPSETDK